MFSACSAEEDRDHELLIEDLKSAIERMEGTVNDVLDFRKLESNMFTMNRRVVVKLGDLGESKALLTGQSFSTAAGTPLTMAPEVLSGNYRPASDVYSWGITMCMVVMQALAGVDDVIAKYETCLPLLIVDAVEEVAASCPPVATMLERCCSAIPAARPSAVAAADIVRFGRVTRTSRRPPVYPAQYAVTALIGAMEDLKVPGDVVGAVADQIGHLYVAPTAVLMTCIPSLTVVAIKRRLVACVDAPRVRGTESRSRLRCTISQSNVLTWRHLLLYVGVGPSSTGANASRKRRRRTRQLWIPRRPSGRDQSAPRCPGCVRCVALHAPLRRHRGASHPRSPATFVQKCALQITCERRCCGEHMRSLLCPWLIDLLVYSLVLIIRILSLPVLVIFSF